ncbi:hypothetical protein CSV71_09770 [Sporosarcina sp. P21c]|uniref:DUF7010 family protein n=1 Tax=Sporosarcina TaxID=1569 RepID=UPI000A15E3B5|nr:MULTISPECIES: hypothetical protein [Sporosarcina]ARJ37444.1 hypothetical protein SporoP8_00265 [Sporosarcina ureae]PIC66930.1 hypothetical protein CSV78_10075 [Sporosarcina sp. P16a]PIC89431.1 hypothetical protein CSV71_09770 [Sporosarcina sp. P21c]PIC92382.1 hypothetical protein CSV70_10820 [Sporosarcina sp. P25]
MTIYEMKNDLSIKGRNGISFILSASVIWLIITIIFMQSLEITQKNIGMLFSTGLMFPLSVGISYILKADWKFKNNALGSLGLYLNLAQILYFPILFWSMLKSPQDAIMIFAIITGAHFFTYGWFYNAKPYYISAPMIAIGIMFLGLYTTADNLWMIPLSMVSVLLLLSFALHMDYRKVVKRT